MWDTNLDSLIVSMCLCVCVCLCVYVYVCSPGVSLLGGGVRIWVDLELAEPCAYVGEVDEGWLFI